MSTQEISQSKIEDAIEQYGGEVVSRALDFVHMSDPDGAYTVLEDHGMFEEAEVVAALFFEN